MKPDSTTFTPPFIRETDSVNKIMTDVIFALVPCCAMAWVAFGWQPVFVLLVACSSAVLTEFLFLRIFAGQSNAVADGSSLVTGILLACTLGPFTPLNVVAFGGTMAVLFGKLLPGGLGRNRFNPALVGREFMTVFYPVIMTSGVIWFDAESVNYSGLSLLSDGFLNSLIFNPRGAVGEYSVLFLVIGGIYLLLRKRISWHIPLALNVAFTLAFLALPSGPHSFSLGGVLLGAIYMATDMPTSSSTRAGRLYFGAMIGTVAALCIGLGVKHAYMSYAILLLNAFVVPVNWVFRPRVWGEPSRWPRQLAQAGGLTVAILGATAGVVWLHNQDWMLYLVLLYAAWCIGQFLYGRYKPEAVLP